MWWSALAGKEEVLRHRARELGEAAEADDREDGAGARHGSARGEQTNSGGAGASATPIPGADETA